MNLPAEYQEKLKELLEEDYDNYLAAFEKTYGQTIRINRLKAEPTQILGRLRMKYAKKSSDGAFFAWKEVPWCPDGFYLETDSRLSLDPLYAAGCYYIQEPSAMAPAAFLPVKEGDRVLDLCAAPGGKSAALAGKLKGTGMLVANDVSASRCKALLKNLEMAGVTNAVITCEKPETLKKHFPEYFDCILVDAPCSGEGMFRKDPSMIKHWSPEAVKEYSRIQEEILFAAANMLRPGGYLVYSTCTYSPEENEQIVKKLLKKDSRFHLCPLPSFDGVSEGVIRDLEDETLSLSRCRRFWNHRVEGEGQFAALFQKEPEPAKQEKEEALPGKKGIKIPEEMKAFFAGVSMELPHKRLYQNQERVYLLPPYAIMEKKLRFVRSGLYLGDIKKKRFEPSQALAMALRPEQFFNCLLLEDGDERTERYLRCETIEAPEVSNGWALVCAEGYPLGWGKAQNGVIKNKYKSGWRRQ